MGVPRGGPRSGSPHGRPDRLELVPLVIEQGDEDLLSGAPAVAEPEAPRGRGGIEPVILQSSEGGEPLAGGGQRTAERLGVDLGGDV